MRIRRFGENLKNKLAIYALTRGYSGFNKIKYKTLIKRNKNLKNIFTNDEATFVIFHEGNITKLDKKIIKFFSRINIKFINIEKDFKPNPNNRWTGNSKFALSYSLMCQFQYYHVWKYLSEYEYAIRVDEDCMAINLPKKCDSQILECGAVIRESHEETNLYLPRALNLLDADEYYDQIFPYTNVFITETKFWLKNEVQNFLYKIYSHENSLEFRWGDLAIIGVACKKFANWDSVSAINLNISYFHESHGSIVKDGIIKINEERIYS